MQNLKNILKNQNPIPENKDDIKVEAKEVNISEGSKQFDQNKTYYNMQQDLMFHQSYNEFQQVVPNLYIGGQVSALNIAKLKELNITRVLKVNGIETAFPFIKYGVNVKVMDIDDMPDFDIAPFFEEAGIYIHEAISKGEGCLVVCTAGISRSASIVISYLMRYQNMNYEQAFNITKKARIYIKPNPGFERSLKALSIQLNCELCNLVQRTTWLPQYTSYQNYSLTGKQQQPTFQVIMCDQCDGPIIIYVKDHKQNLTQDELMEASAICEQVGDDLYGRNQWFIEGKQRTIKDHFHWHVRPMKDAYLSTNLGLIKCKQPKVSILKGSESIFAEIESEKNLTLDQIKETSSNHVKELIKLATKQKREELKVQILEQTTQIVNGGFKNITNKEIQNTNFQIKSILRLLEDKRFSIEQQIYRGQALLFKKYIRGEIKESDDLIFDIISKL